jgi:hypothetical protein
VGNSNPKSVFEFSTIYAVVREKKLYYTKTIQVLIPVLAPFRPAAEATLREPRRPSERTEKNTLLVTSDNF